MPETPLEESRALYFTFKREVEGALAGGPEDAAALAKLHDACGKLAPAAQRLRHNLPDRAVETPTISHPGGYRYFLIHPDGAVVGQSYFAQRPAAVRRAQRAAEFRPELRLWDDREKVFIDFAEADA